MRIKLLILLLTLVVLVGISGSYVVGGLQAYARYQQSSFANQQHCGGQPPVHICVRVPAEIFSAFTLLMSQISIPFLRWIIAATLLSRSLLM